MFKHCPLHRLSHLTSWSVQLPYTYYGLLPNPTDSLLPWVSQLILEGGHVLIGLQCAILFSFMCDILNGALGILFYNLTLPITSPQLHFYPVCSSPWSSWCSLFVLQQSTEAFIKHLDSYWDLITVRWTVLMRRLLKVIGYNGFHAIISHHTHALHTFQIIICKRFWKTFCPS